MESRPLAHQAAHHLEDLAYLMSHLRADPQTASLATDVEPTYSSLNAQIEDWTTKAHDLEEAQTALENSDLVLDNAVRTARGVILTAVDHSRKSPRYVTYFPRGLTEVITAPFSDEVATVRSLAERCAQDPSPEVQAQSALLNTAATQLAAALQRRQDMVVAELTSYGLLQVQKLATIDTCRRVSYRLAELYPNDRARVRSYFRPVSKRTRPKTLPTPAQVPVATAAPAAQGAAA